MQYSKTRAIWILIMALFLGGYIFWADWAVGKQSVEDYTRLHNAAFHGIITRLGTAHHKTSFMVDSGTRPFIFAPVYLPGKDFDYLAAVGDSLFKEAYSDTLTLVKGPAQRYRFHFRK